MDKAEYVVAHDLDRHEQCTFLALLKALLSRVGAPGPQLEVDDLLDQCLDIAVTVSNDPEVKQSLACYISSAHGDCHALFVETFNLAFKMLENKFPMLRSAEDAIGIMFHRNNPKDIMGQYADSQTGRKPDVVLVALTSASRVTGIEDPGSYWSCISTKLAPYEPRTAFAWADCLSCLQFQRRQQSLLGPPALYNKMFSSEAIDPLDRSSFECDELEQSLDGGNPHTSDKTALFRNSDPPAHLPDCNHTIGDRCVISVPARRKASEEQEIPARKRIKLAGRHSNCLPVIKCGLYATEMLCRGPHAMHAINLFFNDDIAWVWWFDRQGAIQSSGINFVQDLPHFLVLLAIFQRFTLADWGINTRLISGHAKQYSISAGASSTEIQDHCPNPPGCDDFEFTFRSNKGTRVMVMRPRDSSPRRSHYSFSGRSTIVYDAKAVTDSNLSAKATLAVKISWAESHRASEVGILQKIADTGHGDALATEHVPVLEDWEDLEYSTETIRTDIEPSGGLEGSSGLKSGPRVLRILLMRKLGSIRMLEPVKFIRAWWECCLCHSRLWQNGIKHTNISKDNLMCHLEGPNKEHGVLNNFDLARIWDGREVSATGTERTGTVPFMALDLLTKEGFRGDVPWLYRHDLESFIWVLPYHLLYGLNSAQDDMLRKWDTADYGQCLVQKRSFLFEPDYQPRPGYEDGWEEVGLPAVWWLRHYIFAVVDKQSWEPVAAETQAMANRWTDTTVDGAIAIVQDFEQAMEPGLKKLGI